MANIVRPVKLPDGTIQDVLVPEEWGTSEIRAALIRKGVIAKSATSEAEAAASVPKDDDFMPPMEDPERVPEAPKEPTFGERFTRQMGLGLRADITGALGFATILGNAANAGLSMIPGVDLPPVSDVVQQYLTDAGLPVPETKGERIAASIQEAAVGTMAGISAAKGMTGAIPQAMTDQAGVQTVAGTAAGAGFGIAAEADVGPIGQVAVGLLAGLAGAGSASTASKAWGRWAESRIRVPVGERGEFTKPLTVDEVKVAAEEAGVKLDKGSEELRQLTEQLEELRVQARIEAETNQLRPAATDTLEQRRFKEAQLRREGKAVPEDVPLEVTRAREAMARRDRQAIEYKIRTLEEQRVRAAPESKQAEAVRANSATQAEQAVAIAETRVPEAAAVPVAAATPGVSLGTEPGILRRDPTVPRNRQGQLKARDRWGVDIIGRVNKISPEIGIAVRRVTQRGSSRTNEDILKIDEFYGSKQYKALPKAEKAELDRALLNSDDVTRDAILGRVPGLQDLYNRNVRSLLMNMQRHRVERGADGFIEEFFPRVVRNVAALRQAAVRNQTAGSMDQALADAERIARKKRGHGLDEREVAAIVNQYMGGRVLKQLKDRRITEIPAEHQKFYEDSRNSLIDYIHKFHNDDAARSFFRDSLGKEVDFGKNSIHDGDIGHLLAGQLGRKGAIDAADINELAELLSVHFGVSRQGVGGFQRNLKNLFTTGVLANVFSTLTQVADIAPVFQKFGVLETLQSSLSPGARRGTKDVDVYSIGVRELSRDLRSAHGTAKLVRNGLKIVGFDKLDKVMANTAVKSGFNMWSKRAIKNQHQAKKLLEPLFGNETDQLIKDLQQRKLSDNVKTLILHEVGDIRPVGREDMPLDYAANPNGRWKYSLLSWTLKQMNFVRNNAQKDWRNGRRLKAVKDVGTLAVLMGLTNGSVMTIKDFLAGREIDPTSNLVTGMLSIGMSGKYAADALASHRSGEVVGSIIPFLGITARALQGTYDAVTELDPMKLIEAIPSGRNMKNLITGNLLPALGAIGATAMTYVIPDAESNTTPAELGQPAPRGMPARVTPVRDELSLLKGFENSIRAGYDPRTKLWTPHRSIEGGTDTLGYGHKLTPNEVKTGKVVINGEAVNYKAGLTDKQISDLTEQDASHARQAVLESVKVPLAANEMAALLSLVYNVGAGAFKKSRALKALNSGDRETFVRRAFDEKIGFTKVNGKVHPGLVRRRAEEREMFAGNM